MFASMVRLHVWISTPWRQDFSLSKPRSSFHTRNRNAIRSGAFAIGFFTDATVKTEANGTYGGLTPLELIDAVIRPAMLKQEVAAGTATTQLKSAQLKHSCGFSFKIYLQRIPRQR